MAWNPCSLCRGITIHFALEWLFSLRGIRRKIFEQLGRNVPGSVDAPLDWGSVTSKFRDCADAAAVPLGTSAVDRVVQLVGRLETVEDVAELARTLA
jgi:hypothetical protein